ncbi:hypothetical protein BDV96DRAFT_608170 [Lophiotrema nucula]|uniref:Heterokaryon incompatibility protein-domain-containing protein n=1 Tax=Lophiotrema nucula TaxID=690887 RepID=A0A6A5YF50_9PLEO|nr:hypothetical protein BDV96DRAFT_608170 [Lophiotrema nucula]
MSGSDAVPWENVNIRLRSDGVYGLNSLADGAPLLVHDGAVIQGSYNFPDTEFRILESMQTAWQNEARSVWQPIISESGAMGKVAMSVYMSTTDVPPLRLRDVPDLIFGQTSKILKSYGERYKAIRSQIYRACANRAMFVTSKGYLGLAPGNAQEGDIVCVLLGGCTPYLLRPIAGSKQFTFVGEAYVYGIMGGELLGHEMGHARMRDFEIV